MLINRFLNLIYKAFDYNYYRFKYNIGKGFKFNGYGIRFFGEGHFNSGNDSYISYCSYINLSSGTKVILGDNVSISNYVRIYTSNVNTRKRILDGIDVSDIGDVIIGNNVLIGSGCFICPGVVIGSNVVIGANSIVNKSIPDNSVYGGVPARLIKDYGIK